MATTEPGREIFWSIDEQGLFYGLAVASGLIVAWGLIRLARFILHGARPESRVQQCLGIRAVLAEILTHRLLAGKDGSRVWHLLVFYGFGLLFLVTCCLMAAHYGLEGLYRGAPYLALTLTAELGGVALVAGTLVALLFGPGERRTGNGSEPTRGRTIALAALLVLGATGFLLEGLRLSLEPDAWACWCPVGQAASLLFAGLPEGRGVGLYRALWWLHGFLALIFLAWVPFSASLRHLLLLPVNRAVRSLSPRCATSPLDFEEVRRTGAGPGEVRLGIERTPDTTGRERLALLSCMNCGRCEEKCPAFQSGQPLSPRRFLRELDACAWSGRSGAGRPPDRVGADGAVAGRQEDLGRTDGGQSGGQSINSQPSGDRNGRLADTGRADRAGGGTHSDDERADRGGAGRQSDNVRADRKGPGKNCRSVRAGGDTAGRPSDLVRPAEAVSPEALWACRLCLACEERCPAGVEHGRLVIEMRQAEVLGHGRLPPAAASALRNLERTGNPYGAAPEEYGSWVTRYEVPTRPPQQEALLVWTGCFPPGEEQKPRALGSLVSLLRFLGRPFFVLPGPQVCCGDPARVLGEEDLFQSIAREQIRRIEETGTSQVLVHCPHCYTVLKDLYPLRGARLPIRHTSAYLLEGLRSGSLRPGGLVNAEDPPNTPGSPRAVGRPNAAGSPRSTGAGFSGNPVVFHDPCFLGRYQGLFEPPREILRALDGLELIEPESHHDQSLCCGAGGGHYFMDLDVKERPSSLRLREALEKRANTLAVSCSFCSSMLEDALRRLPAPVPLRVADWLELLEAAVTPRSP